MENKELTPSQLSFLYDKLFRYEVEKYYDLVEGEMPKKKEVKS